MKLEVFSVYDSAVGAYLQPFYMQSLGAAVRAFSDTVNDPNHHFAKHPADYTLFHIGSFEDEDCSFNLFAAGVPMGKAIEFVKQQDLSLDQPDLPNILKRQSGDGQEDDDKGKNKH